MDIHHITKPCKKCGTVYPLVEYQKKDLKCKAGVTYVSQCGDCLRAAARKRAKKRTPESRKQERARFAKRYGLRMPFTPRQIQRSQYSLGLVWIQEIKGEIEAIEQHRWFARWIIHANKPWLRSGLSDAEQYRLRYRGDAAFRHSERQRQAEKKRKQNDWVAWPYRQGLKFGKWSEMVTFAIGYTADQARRHFELQFHDGMTWELFDKGEIVVDHITPKCEFDLQDEEQWKACWCMSNVRPVWEKENARKADRKEYLI